MCVCCAVGGWGSVCVGVCVVMSGEAVRFGPGIVESCTVGVGGLWSDLRVVFLCPFKCNHWLGGIHWSLPRGETTVL